MARHPRLTHAAGYKGKRISLAAEVYRHVSNSGKAVFQACAELTRGRKGSPFRLASERWACGTGRNPRVALGAALKALGAGLAQRRGAFAGYRRRLGRR